MHSLSDTKLVDCLDSISCATQLYHVDFVTVPTDMRKPTKQKLAIYRNNNVFRCYVKIDIYV